ncbi:flagellar FlbD family protein [Thermosediminibacter oceani]|uniref:Flagellar FlbD family protein n=1 Tax=Thermosediminibacter oceani (strain ATCC BAA-1034 / DSM 16646 / JW/IW-1228P) TaxID=555079 RepID=D9S389_THEOJ|nr:flagellar FlbD family protein [Thermosediminibacter oceani]ADL07866.1 flagellar FlbD family protein [Thermosediminibacter oceani DSM 16646]
MVELTKLNGKRFYLNAELIETIEPTPDTVIKLTNEKTYIVRESPEEVVNKVIEYKRRIVKGSEG